MQTPADERVRELEAELAAAQAEIRTLRQQIEHLSLEPEVPEVNAQVEGGEAA